MATNFFFNNFKNSMEQRLIDDLVVESIKIHGIDCYYLTKTYGDYDTLHNEDDLGYFKEFYECEFYINSADGFSGEGDFLSKFGLEVRDQLNLTVARRSFENEIGIPARIARPREGDLIFFPFNQALFTIQFVEHEPVFYQLGDLQFYEIRCEKFEYSGERFMTGIQSIDDLETTKSFDTTLESAIFVDHLRQVKLNTEDGLVIEADGFTSTVDIDNVADADSNYFQTTAGNFIDFSDADPFSDGGTF
jgi:hypothetical protein